MDTSGHATSSDPQNGLVIQPCLKSVVGSLRFGLRFQHFNLHELPPGPNLGLPTYFSFRSLAARTDEFFGIHSSVRNYRRINDDSVASGPVQVRPGENRYDRSVR